ncbi:MAG: hypothetical protein ACE5GM_05615 [bacterium]
MFLLAGTSPSQAMMVEIPLEQLTREAELIVLGRVDSLEVKDKFNLASITLEKIIKGKFDRQTVEVRFIGGRIGSQRVYIEDSPDYQAGQRALIFLKKARYPQGVYYRTVGMFHGKYLIKGETVVRNKLSVKVFMQKISDILHNGRR